MEAMTIPEKIDLELLDPESDARASGPRVALEIKATEITQQQAKEAAKVLNLSVVAVDNLDAQAIIGRYIEQQGAIRITTGEFMVSNSVRDELIQYCRKEIKTVKSTRTIMALIALCNNLLESKDKALKIINQAQSAGMIKPRVDPPANNLPPRGAKITPIQINNSEVTIGPKPQ